MWEPSDLSSLCSKMDAVIWVPDKDDAILLLEELQGRGVTWPGRELPLTDIHWDEYGEETCYFVIGSSLTYSDKSYAEMYANKDMLFVFYGDAQDEIVQPTVEEIIQMIG